MILSNTRCRAESKDLAETNKGLTRRRKLSCQKAASSLGRLGIGRHEEKRILGNVSSMIGGLGPSTAARSNFRDKTNFPLASLRMTEFFDTLLLI